VFSRLVLLLLFLLISSVCQKVGFKPKWALTEEEGNMRRKRKRGGEGEGGWGGI
jgi:hypothetical protein